MRYVASQMIEAHDPIGASGRPSHIVGDASRYFFLFAMQTIGAAILFWHVVPRFRQVLLDPGGHVARTENLVWSLSAITLMQAGYWVRHRLRLPLPQLFRNALVGYIVLFVARMSFVLLPLFLASSSLYDGLNSRYPLPATSLSLLACSPCSVTRRNSSDWEEH